VHHALLDEALRGPADVCAPKPVTNAELTATLARVLRRPAVLRLPAPLLRLLLGELSDGMLLASQRASAAKLTARGFRFVHDDLETALRRELGRS